MTLSKKNTARLSNLNKTKKVDYRRTLQDWDVWLSKADKNGNDVNLHLENIYLDQLQEDDNFLYTSLQLNFKNTLQKFKNPLVSAEQFYLQYKLSSEEYPINIELSEKAQALAAFKKFANLQKEEYVAFGPVFVLYCRGPVWTTAPQKAGIVVTSLHGRPALTRYLTEKYATGKISLGILDEMMTLATGALKRAVFSIMPNAEREHHRYLLEKPTAKEPNLEELYLAGNLTLKAYEEARFPEAKLAKEKRDAHYPTPEEPQRCIVCRDMTATISCMECPNKACQACIRHECLDKGEPFLYFHHQHCLRFGRPHRQPLSEAEQVRLHAMPGGIFSRGRKEGMGVRMKKKGHFRPPSGTRPRPQQQQQQQQKGEEGGEGGGGEQGEGKDV